MALPMVIGGISAGLNLLGSIGGSAAARKAADARAESQIAFAERDYRVNINDLKVAAGDINNELGMILTDLGSAARQGSAVTSVNTTERSAYGNSAARSQGMVEMKAALQKDRLEQAAESKIVDVQNSMRASKYRRENAFAEAMQARSNTYAQQPSGLAMLAGAASAGLSGYSMGMNMQLGQ